MIESWKKLINTALSTACSQLLPDYDDLGAASRYSLLGSGKRLRGLLCLAVANDLGVVDVERVANLDVAVALEAVHAASLIHDDLPALDNDDLRRGKPSCHRAFSEGTAILAGDALIGVAFAAINHGTMANDKKVTSTALITEAWIKLCRGQVLDLKTRGRAVSHEVMELKTGALFSAAVGCGAVLSGCTGSALLPWKEWGLRIGTLFQQIDDLLDGEGGEEELATVRDALHTQIQFLREHLLNVSPAKGPTRIEEVLSHFIPQEMQHSLRHAV